METTTRDLIITRLLNSPHVIAAHEEMVLIASNQVRAAADHLHDTEACLLCGPPGGEPFVNGKNAEQRAAELHQRTATERDELRKAENRLSKARAALGQARDEFSAARSLARLLAVEPA